MGKLVRFEKPVRITPVQAPPEGGGKVLMFTGVQYKRSASKPEKTTSPDKPGRKRG